jgi:DNA invertase Pin-like site-specific DNA recombinase
MARKSRKKANCQISLQKEAAAKTYRTAIYVRISKEDIRKSIHCKLDNQEQLIRDYIKKNPEFQIFNVYADNGFSGTNFERPGFEKLLQDIEHNKVNCIVVKDLSRLGRNHIETEQYISEIFPHLGVRFIAINDHFDSFCSTNEIEISLKNIINEAYAKDIAQKISAAKKVQRLKGEFTGSRPPFGYVKSPDSKYKLVVQRENSEIVRTIFQLKIQGETNGDIARYLNEHRKIAPMAFCYQNGWVKKSTYRDGIWESHTVKAILKNQVYVGDMVQGKKKRCLVSGKIKATKPADYIVISDTHEAIIDRIMFHKVQQICASKRSTINSKLKGAAQEDLIYEDSNVKGYGRLDETVKFILNSVFRLFIKLSCDQEEISKLWVLWISRKIKIIQKELDKQKNYFSFLYKELITGNAAPDVYRQKKNMYIQEKQQLLNKIENILRLQKTIYINSIFSDLYLTEDSGSCKSFGIFIKQVRLGKSKRIHITLLLKCTYK